MNLTVKGKSLRRALFITAIVVALVIAAVVALSARGAFSNVSSDFSFYVVTVFLYAKYQAVLFIKHFAVTLSALVLITRCF